MDRMTSASTLEPGTIRSDGTWELQLPFKPSNPRRQSIPGSSLVLKGRTIEESPTTAKQVKNIRTQYIHLFKL